MPKAKKKKVNPNRQPASQADVEKAKHEATDKAVTYAWALFFLSLRDVYGFGPERLKRLWNHICSRAEDVQRGTLDLEDCLKTLEDECGLRLVP